MSRLAMSMIPTTDELEKYLTKEQYLEILEGMEILSQDWEGGVLVEDGQFIQLGEVIVAEPTLKQYSDLMADVFIREFGTGDAWEELADEFDDEFSGHID